MSMKLSLATLEQSDALPRMTARQKQYASHQPLLMWSFRHVLMQPL